MTSMNAIPLDVSTFPLTGQSLIEASAGTGKTFTIASLYSRLSLGHNTGLQPLGCDQILVVTFTKAATEELRGRIRERLRGNLEDLLRQQAGLPLTDGLLASWLQQLDWSDEQLQQQIDSLQANLSAMDDASIYTIHGFCQRMLKQFAFDSGVMFSADLEMDTASWLKQACEDVWRQHMYRAERTDVLVYRSVFPSPDELMSKIRGWFSRPDTVFVPSVPAAEAPDSHEAEQAFEKAMAVAQASGWQSIGDLLLEAATTKQLNNNSYKPASIPGWLKDLQRWFDDGFSLKVPAKAENFTARQLSAKTSKGKTTPEHDFFDAMDVLLSALEPLQQYQHQLLKTLPKAWFDEVKTRYFQLLEQAGALSPDDLLRLLDSALQGAQGSALAQQIRTLYPVALIDEFQDTDPMQYRIFQIIYATAADTEDGAESAPACGLTAIGDPKQAIYAFRGADIFTYIQARRQMPPERIFTLDTNWRSHSRMIGAVNRLFDEHPSPFVFDDDIPFFPVNAAGKHDDAALRLNGKAAAPLQFWLPSDAEAEEETREAGVRRCAEDCADSIQRMLAGAAQLGEQTAQARDMAVLVRTNAQAQMMRDALAQRGIAAVLLSRESVFKSTTAVELLNWLSAVAEPADERLLRNALATRLHGFSVHQIYQLQVNERELERQLEWMHHYHERWNRNGIMAAILDWMARDDRAARIRHQADGERTLTNLLHLGELLQQSSRRLKGQQALLRWFRERVLDANESGEDAQLRLESDANLVSIVTIHKSKGLEYPLVFLPFVWADLTRLNNVEDVRYFDGEQVILNLDASRDERDLAARDKRAEYMRLLYVALTRPVQGCFVWLSKANVGGRAKNPPPVLQSSALGELLQIQQRGWQGLEELSDDSLYLGPAPELQPGEAASSGAYAERQGDNAQLQAADFTRKIDRRWRVSSFTALSQQDVVNEQGLEESQEGGLRQDEGSGWQQASGMLNAGLPAAGTAGVIPGGESMSGAGNNPTEVNAELAAEAQRAARQQAFVQHLAMQFPRGSQAGTCLHSIFEHWNFTDNKELQRDVLPKALRHFGLLDDVLAIAPSAGPSTAPSDADEASEIPIEEHPAIEQLSGWLQHVVTVPLRGDIQLHQLDSRQRLDEMEFCLPVGNLFADGLNALLRDSRSADMQRPKLQFRPLDGYLKGFIDLIFCVDGRYYLLDYKSNYLGDNPENYLGEALDQAMAAHYYDLQARIYSLALDQFLRHRIPDYSPAQHLGGVFYLFLRGMQPGCDAQSGVWFSPIDPHDLARWQRGMLRLPATESVEGKATGPDSSSNLSMNSGTNSSQQGELPF